MYDLWILCINLTLVDKLGLRMFYESAIVCLEMSFLL